MHDNKGLINLPNMLTSIRLVLSPLALPILLVYLLPYNVFWINSFLAILFVLFGLTDFFDGYFARRYGQETLVGGVLDPIADKFLLYSVLVALLAADKIFFYWVIILIGREFFIMGLRHVALEHNFSVPVSFFGKLKTAIQITCLTYIILNPYQQFGLRGALYWNGIESVLLLVTIFLSLYSAHQYHQSFLQKFNKQQGTNNPTLLHGSQYPVDDYPDDEDFSL